MAYILKGGNNAYHEYISLATAEYGQQNQMLKT
jgi:hypothetical protein